MIVSILIVTYSEISGLLPEFRMGSISKLQMYRDSGISDRLWHSQ